MINKIRQFLNDDDKSVTKAAFYYLICQFLIKGMAFISTPIFTRMLTKDEFGDASNFFAWQALLLPLVTLDLRVTINRSRYDYDKDNDSYLASIVVASNFFTLIFLGIIELNKVFFVKLFSMDMMYIRAMFLYIIFQTAFDYQQIQFNIYHKYKKYVFYTILSAITSLGVSVILVMLADNRIFGRIFGTIIPAILVDIIIYANILKRSKKIKIEYIKYAVIMAIPLIPSALSSTILSSSDRAMITSMCGSEQTALYSVAYSVSSIAAVLWSALNQAWSPWLFDKLNEKKYEEIKRFSNKFALLYTVLVVGIMLIAPEIVYLLGGKSYMTTISIMPPVIIAMICQFFYAFYFNVEYFYGETYVISIGTLLAAVTNLVLNYIYIPQYGYIAAAYTTMIGYAIMYLYHYCIVKYKLKKSYIYNNGFLLILVLSLSVLQVAISLLYDKVIVRYVLIAFYLSLFCYGIYKNKELIQTFIKKLKRKDS